MVTVDYVEGGRGRKRNEGMEESGKKKMDGRGTGKVGLGQRKELP